MDDVSASNNIRSVHFCALAKQIKKIKCHSPFFSVRFTGVFEALLLLPLPNLHCGEGLS